jgi:hypothetical protein
LKRTSVLSVSSAVDLKLFIVLGARKGHERLFSVKTGKHDAMHQKTADCFSLKIQSTTESQSKEVAMATLPADTAPTRARHPLPVFHPP